MRGLTPTDIKKIWAGSIKQVIHGSIAFASGAASATASITGGVTVNTARAIVIPLGFDASGSQPGATNFVGSVRFATGGIATQMTAGRGSGVDAVSVNITGNAYYCILELN